MKTQKDIPYGISDFRTLILEKRYYVDRTNYIEKLESSSKYLFFLRPRRFGKSLLISMLNYYYGAQYKDEFESMFGELYAGKNLTKGRNNYYVMKFEFTSIDTSIIKNVLPDFNNKIQNSISDFNSLYKLLDENKLTEIFKNVSPASTFRNYITAITPKLEHKIMVLIDEYDHFTNEILSFHTEYFADIVSKNGFVRKFYESVKYFTGQGIVDRFFATGVTPVTLDSMTSGFNIAVNISGEAEFNEMAGFTTAEVKQMIYDLFADIEESVAETILKDAALWYNGSLFSGRAVTKLYNPAMLLRFVSKINPVNFEYPEKMIDKNVLSDFLKIKNLVKIENYDENLEAVRTILETGTFSTELTEIFNLEQKFSTQDVISLLYYNGLLTQRKPVDFDSLLEIPNYVIKEVYWKFFADALNEKYMVNVKQPDIRNAVRSMADKNDVLPIAKIVESILKQLSNRDFIRFYERDIKFILIMQISLTNAYLIKSELEVNRQYPDLLFLTNKIYFPKYQHLFELKYLKKKDAANLDSVKEEAINQIKGYMQLEDLKIISNLKYWLIIFVGDDCAVCEEVKNNC